ncbi:MAG: 50S ribosomal protein L21 [Bdellovibrionales bacterium GWB1_55_8]|nr:MAG: 50S ribosomal protein L21 [Bdellovibrionales bacterium GWB1_55_8]
MYAVIQTGGKQYRVQPGDVFQVEKLEGDVGSALTFDQVLLLSKPNGETPQIWLGKPSVSGATVKAEIVGQGRGEKIVMVKMKRRKQYRRTQGHRQEYTQLIVTDVDNGSGEKATLSASDKQAKVTSFKTQLKPKGEAFTPKTLGSRKRLAAKAKEAKASPKAATPAEAKPAKKKAAAKK